jgi:hypothetical protein
VHDREVAHQNYFIATFRKKLFSYRMEEEGVIKFDLRYTAGPAVPENAILELNKWRNILWEHALIGQDPARYDGYGFGNISQRIGKRDAAIGRRAFAISGTQTGHLKQLGNQHYARVTAYNADSNQVVADGPVRPSSESMTHGVIYDREVVRLFSETDVGEQGIFSMGGHEDGIVAFGSSTDEAGNRLLAALACSKK